VLVTGGAGFIGRSVAERLRATHAVDATDLVASEHTRLLDVRDAAAVDASVQEADAVIHFAAVVGVQRYLADPLVVLDTNLLGSRNVLAACARHGVPVLFSSTSEVYGSNALPLREDSSSVLGPTHHARWSYAVSKLAAEHYAHALAGHGLSFCAVRYFNVYGPGLDAPGEGRVVSQFLGALLAGRALPLVDGGQAVRSLCFIDDAVDATIALFDRLRAGDCPSIVNVGRHEPISMRQLAAAMMRLSGREVGTQDIDGTAFFGPGFEEIPSRIPDLSLLRTATGFEAGIDLESGLARTLEPWGLLAESPASAPSPQVPFVRVNLAVTEQLGRTLAGSLQSGRVTNEGPLVRQLEARLAKRLQVPDAVVVGSGAAGLLVVAAALGRPGAVLMPSFTFAATASAFSWLGHQIVPCDIDPTTWTLDPADVWAAAQGREVAVIVPVTVFGVPADIDALQGIAPLVIDDAHGFTTIGPRNPALARVYSLHATKVLPAVEGGLVVGPPDLLAEVRRLRRHGGGVGPGFNARMDELRAAVALAQLDDFDEVVAQRRADAMRLRARLRDRGWVVQRVPEGVTSSFQNVGARLPGKGAPQVVAAFVERAVEARQYFHPCLHDLPRLRAVHRPLPATTAVTAELVCLPLHNRMSRWELSATLDAIDAVTETLCPS
jgi:nucleoside-diphosphate-sugar epimerase/dTDP-4-amino-4,6-dideoxygalactose transaminase